MPSSRPSILILTNSPNMNVHAGQINGYELLVASGELKSVSHFSHCLTNPPRFSEEQLIEQIAQLDFDILLVWTPKLFPSSEDNFQRILSAVGNRPIFYYDGDPWLPSYRHLHKPKIKRKSASKQMSWWASNSEGVFTVASKEHFKIFRDLGARQVHFMPHTYCHFHCSEIENIEPEEFFKWDVVMIGSNLARIPSLTGVPGSFNRLRTASLIRNMEDVDFKLYGTGWPRSWNVESVPFTKQALEFRKARISVNWDHFENYSDYASDRLPISLLAGRPHITTKHPGMDWIPGEDIGLFEADSPSDVVMRLENLLNLGDKKNYELGLQGHRWVKNRFSHREAARYIMSIITPNVSPLQIDPWDSLPSISF